MIPESLFKPPRASSKFNIVVEPGLFYQHHKQTLVLGVIVMVLRGIRFPMSDIGSSGICVSFVALSKADPLTASTISFLFFKIIAILEWDIPDW